MRKTSVYLPDDLKHALADAAARWDRSEAELIRLAIEQFVAAPHATTVANPAEHGLADDPSPAAPPRRARAFAPPTGPRLVGVGVGPGSADLLTQRARTVLAGADRVFAASTALDAIGRAEAIVRSALPDVGIDRLVLTIAADDGRARSVHTAAERIADELDHDRVVAFVTLGDPNLFSTFGALAAEVTALRPDVPVESVPGILAFQELAAHSGTMVAGPEANVHLVTLTDDLGPIERWLAEPGDAVVVNKGGRNLPALAVRLAAADRLDGAVLGELLGLPGETTGPVAAAAGRPASYLATVIVPPAARREDGAGPA